MFLGIRLKPNLLLRLAVCYVKSRPNVTKAVLAAFPKAATTEEIDCALRIWPHLHEICISIWRHSRKKFIWSLKFYGCFVKISSLYFVIAYVVREDEADLTKYIEVTLHYHSIFNMQDIFFFSLGVYVV